MVGTLTRLGAGLRNPAHPRRPAPQADGPGQAEVYAVTGCDKGGCG